MLKSVETIVSVTFCVVRVTADIVPEEKLGTTGTAMTGFCQLFNNNNSSKYRFTYVYPYSVSTLGIGISRREKLLLSKQGLVCALFHRHAGYY